MSKHKKIIHTLLAISALSWSSLSYAFNLNPFATAEQKLEDTTASTSTKISKTIKRNVNPCLAGLCSTMAGLIDCLLTNQDYATWEGGQFFKKNPDGTYMQRVSNVVIATRTTSTGSTTPSGTATTYQQAITVPVVVNVISPSAFKAFQNVARANPNCMETFCKKNCLLLSKLDPKAIHNKVKDFEGQPTIIISGVTYKSPALPAQPATDTTPAVAAVAAVNKWDQLDSGEKFNLTQSYLLDQSNHLTNIRCLSETDGGVKLRMFCSQCAQNLSTADKGLLSPTCLSFDSSRNVGYGMEATELSDEYQRQLTLAQIKQDAMMREQALAAQNPNSAANNGSSGSTPYGGAAIDFNAIANSLTQNLPNIRIGTQV